VNRVPNAESIFSGGNTPAGRDGARPSGAEAQKNKKSEGRIRSRAAFTLIELIIVIGIIVFLAGLILGVSGYVQEKGKRARAEAEIAAMSAALESYKADNGIYPRDGNTDVLTAVSDQGFSTKNPPDPGPTSYNADPTRTDAAALKYRSASFSLYAQLSGNISGDRSTVTQKTYFQFKPNMLYPKGGTGTVAAILDSFGNVYGYSTAKVNDSTQGFNPTYDMWSTGGTNAADKAAYEQKWIKNW